MTDLSRRIDDFLALAENDALEPRLHILARQLLEEARRELGAASQTRVCGPSYHQCQALRCCGGSPCEFEGRPT